MRDHKPRPVGLGAILIATVIVAGGLFAVFSFAGAELFTGRLPLGITAQEVEAYAGWFDRRPGQAPSSELSLLQADDLSGAQGRTPLRSGERQGMVVYERRVEDPDAMVMRTSEEALLGTDRHVLLHPASPDDLRRKFLQLLAEELGLLSPEVGFVHLASPGMAQRPYCRVPIPDGDWLFRHGMNDGVAVTWGLDPERPQQYLPAIAAQEESAEGIRARMALACPDGGPAPVPALLDLVERDQVAGWMLMLHLEGHGDPFRTTQAFAWRTGMGRWWPIYTPLPPSKAVHAGPIACNPFTPLLDDPAFRAAMQAQRDKLLEARGRLRERCEAYIDALAPHLAGGGSVRLVKARAREQLAELLDRRLGMPFDPLSLLRPTIPPAGHATLTRGASTVAPVTMQDDAGSAFAAFKRRTRVVVQGDSVVFPRGRYVVEEDLVLPAGHRVVLLPGARFEIAPGRSVLCRGPLEVRGTTLNPVFIRPQNAAAPYGTFAVRGGGASIIKGLRMSGGAGATMLGEEHEAMLSIAGMSRTEIDGCELTTAGQPILSIEGGRLAMEGNVFHGGELRLRQVQGRITACGFTGDARGHGGARQWGGRILVEKGRFSGIHEVALEATAGAQVMVSGCTFKRNGTAIRLGGLTVAHVIDCQFEHHDLVFHLPDAGGGPGGRLHRYANTIVEARREVEVAPNGAVVADGTMDPAVARAFGVE
ncbi:MAG: hypothetical protein KIT10_06650 [Flavobacteriales bacterium]|nr:hypothetical protein [Flavobacteriales bacterium]